VGETLPRTDEAALERSHTGRGAIVHAHLIQDVVQVDFHCTFSNVKEAPDFLVASAIRHQVQNFQFPFT